MTQTFESKSGHLRLSELGFLLWKRLQKSTFRRKRFVFYDLGVGSIDFGVIFTGFLMALGTILVTFGALEAGLKLDDFRWLSGGPGVGQPWPGGGILYLFLCYRLHT